MTVPGPYPPGRPPVPSPSANGRATTPGDAPSYPGATDLTLAMRPVAPQRRRRRRWPWLLAVVVIAAAAVSGWVFLIAPARADQRSGNTAPMGSTFTFPSGLGVSVSDINPYTSTNPVVVPPGSTAYRGMLTVTNGTTGPVHTALMTVDVTTAAIRDDRIFENAPPPTQDIAPGQQLQIPFAFTIVKQASGPLRVTVTALRDQAPVVFTETTP